MLVAPLRDGAASMGSAAWNARCSARFSVAWTTPQSASEHLFSVRGSKEMMQPYLIHLHVVSLIAGRRAVLHEIQRCMMMMMINVY